jgi:hypothetical protein
METTINRHTARGLTFTLKSKGREDTIVTLNPSGKTMIFHASFHDMSMAWYQWQMRGWKIQEAFGFLSPEEREFLMTGITPEEWNKIFPKEDE